MTPRSTCRDVPSTSITSAAAAWSIATSNGSASVAGSGVGPAVGANVTVIFCAPRPRIRSVRDHKAAGDHSSATFSATTLKSPSR
ncbi:MAG: hypothetical protein IPJ62_17620 [Betaproteobacteria bacterium]|nr:hypothetical protein [Betaproteobacteria bacterium]